MDPFLHAGRSSARDRGSADDDAPGAPKIAPHAQAGIGALRWVAVMGKRWVYSRQAVAPYPWQRALVFAVLALITLLAAPSDGCRVDQCWHRYNNAVESDQIERGANSAFCKALSDHSDCIRDTARSCRGDLKYHSTYSLVSQWNNEYNCSYIILMAGSPTPVTRAPKPPRPTVSHACSYHGKHDFQHCALFGDPHLRTFANEFHTCKVLGAWPLVNNAYLAVQVTNDAVGPANGNATAPTKVTVLIKGGNSACAHHKTYEAQVGNLPSAFVDGTQSSGSDRTVRIKEKEAGRHVEIVIRYIATTIVVRQVGDYLNVALRMPRDVAAQGAAGDDLEFCVRGCPASERIDHREFLARPQMGALSRGEALAQCRAGSLTDFYLDACVFDLVNTGDPNFCQAAVKALHDLRVLNPALYAKQPNRTDLLPPPTKTVVTVEEGPVPSAGGECSALGGCSATALLLLTCCLAAILVGRPNS